MKLLSGLIGEVGSVVSTLSVSSKEKKQIEADLIAAISRQEEALAQSQAGIIQAEAQGNWLQRSWRPIIMLVFAAIVYRGYIKLYIERQRERKQSTCKYKEFECFEVEKRKENELYKV